MKFPTFESTGEGQRRMISYEGYRFPEMNLDELEDHLLRCLEGAQSFIEERGREVEDSMINTLAAAGNALIVCRLMRQCCTDYEKERKRRGKLLRLTGRGEA